MRIGVMGPVHDDSFADNVISCLPDIGARPVVLGAARSRARSARVRYLNDVVSNAVTSWDLRQQSPLVDRALNAELDAVICTSSQLFPQSVSRIREAGVPIALWFPDAITNLGRQLMVAADYTRLYFKDEGFVSRLRATTGLPVSYLPEACNPRWHKPLGASPPSRREVAVVGNMYPSRTRLLERLDADDVPLALYGGGFPRWMPPSPLHALHMGREVVREEKAQVFRSSGAVLNNLHPAEEGANCRLFEATGSGAAVLCEDRPAIRRLFSDGEDVVLFSSYKDLRRKALRLLDDPDAARSIGDAAARRAHSEHTYQRRLEVILNDLVR